MNTCLAVLSPNLIDRVEVVRGPLSHIYGSDAMGGVVSMSTDSKEGANFMASIGSHGSYSGNFSGTAKLREFTLGLSVNTQRYSDNVVNDVFKNTGLSTRLNFKKEKIDAGLRIFGNITDSGIPFNDGIPSPTRHYKQDYLIFALPFVFTLSPTASINVQLAYTNSKYEFKDPNDPWGAPYFKNKFANYEAEVTYNGRFFEKLDIRAGLDYSDQGILNETYYGTTLDNVKMNYFSSFVSTALNLGALQISSSMRYDKYKNVIANLSPHIGISYLAANRFKFRASYAQSFLAPMVSQIVNPWGMPNFELKPEKGKSFEVGAEYYAEKVVLSAVYFSTKYRDMIDWVTVDWTNFTGQYRNIANVDTYGLELTGTFRPVYHFTLSGSYTYLHTEDRATGEPLIRKPKHTFSGFLTYGHKRFTISAGIIYVGKRSDLDYQAWPPYVTAPAFNTFDFNLVVPVTDDLSVFGKLTNAFDQDYQEFIGYPAPGRRFELGIKYKIK
ncbi:MAG: TonB-dependent receptor [Acidobacteria bacterium]|nr:TonB-dependent receptor [Acidobacteriota bacterium]